MPQLDTTTFASQLFWLGICFLVLYFILSFSLVPKITGILENRNSVRQQKINQASIYREQAEGLLVDYERTLTQARKDAHEHYQSIVSTTNAAIEQKKREMQGKLEEQLRLAEQKLYRARVEASADLHSLSQEIADEILEKLTGHVYSAGQRRKK